MTTDREPPVFPRVGDPDREAARTSPDRPLFTSASAPAPEPDDLQRSPAADPLTPPWKGDARVRWAVAGLATLLVVAVVGAVLLLGGSRAGTPSIVEYYVPADTAAYVEVRLDFPGDQRERLATFMSHFPGFADPAAFQRKVDESLDQLLRSNNAGIDWTNDVAPWFGGELALFGQTLTPTAGTPPSMVVALTIKDRGRLEALIDERLTNVPVETRDHQGRQIRTVVAGPGGHRLSFVVTDELLLIATRIEDLQTALDVKAGNKPALAQDEFFLQQLGALSADRLATAYYDMGRVVEATQSSPTDVLGLQCAEVFQASSRVKYVAQVRAEGDHLAITTRSQPPSGPNMPPLPQNHASVLTAAMPANTIAYFEGRQVGANVRAVVSQFLDCLASTDTPFDPRSLEQFLGTAPESYFDFVGDMGVALTFENDLPGGGLIATVDDEAVARQRMERLLATIRALTSFGGEGVTVDDVEHNGVAITVFSFGQLPPGIPPTSLSVAVANGRVYVGVNDFVTAALDRQSADSLAVNTGVQAALAAGGTENAGLMYVDAVRVRALIEAKMAGGDRVRYETEVKPFLEPVTSAAVVNRADDGILVSNVFLYVE